MPPSVLQVLRTVAVAFVGAVASVIVSYLNQSNQYDPFDDEE